MSEPEEICVFCKGSLIYKEGITVLTAKGCEGIQRACTQRNEIIITVAGQKVHTKCKKRYCNSKYIALDSKKRKYDEVDSEGMPSTRSSTGSAFDIREQCLFCGQGTNIPLDHRPDSKLTKVSTLGIKDTIIEDCNKRNDLWAEEVLSRIEYVQDLFAADAVYHKQCRINFRIKRQMPGKYIPDEYTHPIKQAKRGRNKDSVKSAAFQQVAEYLESHDDEQTTVNNLIDKMTEYLPPDETAYGFTYMKSCLQNHFGDTIVITEVNGKPNVVTFRHKASSIINDFYSRPKDNDSDVEKMRIIEAACKLIKSDIKSVAQNSDNYPEATEMSSLDNVIAFLPTSLKLMLEKLFSGKDTRKKVGSIGQAIMQAVRPRALMAPLQLGLAIQLHHHFGSRFLIDILYELGFGSSYSEVQRFECSAAVTRGTAIGDLTADDFVQYMADNVDHNSGTIDGHNTFHGMGMIATVTPARKLSTSVPRAKVSFEEIQAAGRVNIVEAPTPRPCIGPQLIFKEVVPSIDYATPEIDAMEALYDMSLCFANKRPSWSGTMQMVHEGPHPGPSTVLFLPMINLDPTNVDCIYSTLQFISEHAARYDVTPVITFDQPLWWKALHIILSLPAESPLRGIILRLGGFHTLMSYLGSIGCIMEDSGIRHVLQLGYAQSTVDHMLSGKAYARAVRGHLLVAATLHKMLISRALDLPLASSNDNTPECSLGLVEETDGEEPDDDETSGIPPYSDVSPSLDANDERDDEDIRFRELDDGEPDGIIPGSDALQSVGTTDATHERTDPKQLLEEVEQLFEGILAGEIPWTEASESESLKAVTNTVEKAKHELEQSRTAKLWFQYLDMVSILRDFIWSERTGDWKLHLRSLTRMLPFLAASGHHFYTKSLYIYLTRLFELPETHPHIYEHVFQKGLHVVRRSDRMWAGLSTDLVIEQVLMRSLKTTGGLTRGRGMDERQRLIWALSNPVCAEYNNAMQEFTNVGYATSDQHKDMGNSRIQRDTADIQKMEAYLAEKSPFVQSPDLFSLDTGVCAHPAVNVDNARQVGWDILKLMAGQNVAQFVFKRSFKVVTMGKKITVCTGKETFDIDPQLLFQGQVTAELNAGELPRVFTFELCTYPPALFDQVHCMSAAQKSSLVTALKKYVPVEDLPIPDNVVFVVDGGGLIYRIPWQTGKTWSDIGISCAHYVTQHYGKPTVGFDGYKSGPTTKDAVHARRNKGTPGPEVQFTPDMVCTTDKLTFMSNDLNKERLIKLLTEKLREAGCEVIQAPADADVLLVNLAMEKALEQDTALVGDDSDLLMQLCSRSSNEEHDIYFRPEPKANQKCPPTCWNIGTIQAVLGPEVCKHLMFLHTMTGSDTTSRLLGVGKSSALNKLITRPYLREQAALFRSIGAEKKAIIEAGERAIVCLYGGSPGESLDTLRLQSFHKKVSSSTTAVQPRSLPPTSAAARYHSLRVYHQVQQWQCNDLDPEEWGWMIQNDVLVPIMTDLKPAPQYLLEAIHCGCKTDCSTRRCGCRKYGLECSLACSNCKGLHCKNVTLEEVTDNV